VALNAQAFAVKSAVEVKIDTGSGGKKGERAGSIDRIESRLSKRGNVEEVQRAEKGKLQNKKNKREKMKRNAKISRELLFFGDYWKSLSTSGEKRRGPESCPENANNEMHEEISLKRYRAKVPQLSLRILQKIP